MLSYPKIVIQFIKVYLSKLIIMQISRKQIDQNLELQIKDVLAQVISDIKSKDQALQFLQDFLTNTELVALTKRLAVALSLDKKMSYEQIKKQLQVSSATIASVQSAMQKQPKGYEIALRLAKAEEFAIKWSQKLNGLFEKNKSK
ncbi:hypothetical protein COX08_04345 [Candidatus Beckwithbacteria bacterium CG23_combo_of_CG06-09_8_20_14_all_34_8]|uniref:Uncharacterized protein n=1 Tax=Candidatus Beckwithbacteria bacterium CG23_combo_of_CG06-09_8_20_14_all_34_8 TaxID=1974497 RepID=A0A2H0B5C9_9BACT|nr:MAG: hypothetical protein COX08_04345 [Candidatus Beckwithbacteria bacterium CG23_combo_of_CG06-09_8_20_14_all_34_8]